MGMKELLTGKEKPKTKVVSVGKKKSAKKAAPAKKGMANC